MKICSCGNNNSSILKRLKYLVLTTLSKKFDVGCDHNNKSQHSNKSKNNKNVCKLQSGF